VGLQRSTLVGNRTKTYFICVTNKWQIKAKLDATSMVYQL